jgi:hypothetical protein
MKIIHIKFSTVAELKAINAFCAEVAIDRPTVNSKDGTRYAVLTVPVELFSRIAQFCR